MKRIINSILLSLTGIFAASAQTADIHFLKHHTETVLEEGIHYAIRFDSLYINSSDRVAMSPLAVKPFTVATIELRYGQKIIVRGSNGPKNEWDLRQERQGYPGILVPPTASLIVYGDGEVIAYGGDAGRGSVGSSGGNGNMNYDKLHIGDGGDGGIGGGGGAPGIGGYGGNGGKGGISVKTGNQTIKTGDNYKVMPTDGVDGGKGETAGSMGDLYVLGNVKITTTAGKNSSFAYGYAPHGAGLNYLPGSFDKFFRLGYGGGGGNGGNGVAAKYDIGGGAPGAGGGGSGGSGGYSSASTRKGLVFLTGQGGRGGESQVDSLHGKHGEGKLYSVTNGKGKGGQGGKPGYYGNNGKLYLSGNVTINGTYDPNSLHTVTSLSMVPSATHQLLSRPVVGAIWNDQDTLQTFVGQEMPQTAVSIPSDVTKGEFMGYYDQYGKKVYDAQGHLALDKADHSYNFDVRTVDGTDHWYVNALDTIRLTPAWSGVKNVIVVRHFENPDYSGYKTDLARYTTGEMITEHLYIPKTKSSVRIAVYPDSEDGIDRNLYTYINKEVSDSLELTLDDTGKPTIVEMLYDRASFKLAWEGLTDDILSRRCTNLNEYTRTGNYAHGKTIIYPELRQMEGSELKCWKRKMADGTYTEFKDETMPQEDIILCPEFADVTFKALAEHNEGGKVILTSGSETITEQTDVKYHQQIKVSTVCDADYRCKSIHVVTADSQREIELTEKDGTITFLMPDEDVKVSVEFEYHPYYTLEVSNNNPNTRFYVTKDWKTFYTDDAGYYGFSAEQLAGKIKDIKYGVGDRYYIHTDLEQKHDNGAREPRMYAVRGSEEGTLLELERSFSGVGTSTLSFFILDINELMMSDDLGLQIFWTDPRAPRYINAIASDQTDFTELYSNNYDISDSSISYYDDIVTFTIESSDDQFDASNIEICYKEGKKNMYMTANMLEDNSHYAFRMPDSNIDLRLVDGNKYSIITENGTETESDSLAIIAPAIGVSGSHIPFSINKNSEQITEAEAEQIKIYVNGMPIEQLAGSGKNSFVMPDEDVVLTIKSDGGTTGIREINVHRKVAGVYNLMGQKVNSYRNVGSHSGIYIINGRKVVNK